MNGNKPYDVAVIGGGLGGLALSIQSATAGYRTILFEKESYPFHKVCGEYVSAESRNFLAELGLPLHEMNLPLIRRLQVTAPNGNKLEQDLPLGGFGISRYCLDASLAAIARSRGVDLRENAKVRDVQFRNDLFVINGDTDVQAKVAVGAFGKRSNLDITWKRPFSLQKAGKLNNFVAIKYHAEISWPPHLIALHNFPNGYCGISSVEQNKCCLCYITTAQMLHHCGNSVKELERRVLCQNPHLAKIFDSAKIIYESPLTISQISFAKKSQVENHILLLGDAAGMIAPLCGNGMSMALHASKLAFENIHLYFSNKISRAGMESQYRKDWKKQFARRLAAGRIIQRFFGNPSLSNLLITFLKPVPRLTRSLIRQTHGQPF